MKKVIQSNKEVGLFRYLIILTGFYIVLELSLFTQASELYLGDYQMVAENLKIPMAVLPGVIYFICAQLLVHLLFIAIIYVTVRLMAVASTRVRRHIEQSGLMLWILGILIILLINQMQFPNSKFAMLTKAVIHPPLLAKILLGLFLIIFTFALLIAFYGVILVSARYLKVVACALGGALLISLGLATHHQSHAITDGALPNRPNVILIGIDAVRPDFLGYFGAGQYTPHIDNFLEQSTVFSESLTPIARTFPAWVSILTGAYPKQSNVRYNLSDQMTFDLRQTLPAILRNQGYQTIYAMDETRFSNITEHFGFDKIITPPMGFNDFLVGSINDFPMSNLIVNTVLGKYLFPYSYANRPVYTTYYPDTFLTLLNQTLEQPRNKPLFLAVHFCITHYPYAWADIKYSNNDNGVALYRVALKKADTEFFQFLQMLKKNKLLDNTIVVLLSDHGESFWLKGDRVTEESFFVPGADNKERIIPKFYPGSLVGEKLNQSIGHGTDVLGLTQSHTVLSFRFFGMEGQKANLIPGWVSLLDIKPTILDILKINIPLQNGRSLTDLISGKKQQLLNRNIFSWKVILLLKLFIRCIQRRARYFFKGFIFFKLILKQRF